MYSKTRKPEILAPGGSFDSAIHSLKSGADAVYFGLKLFSARKSAVNLDFDECRKLKEFAANNNKKIYAAINTIILENEIAGLIKILKFLESIDIDGLIIQDPALIVIAKKYFPDISLHASTQMAVHSSKGVEFLKSQGFKRMVLARELSFKEINKIVQNHPDIEFEIFVHGALCYSFSGMCLASGLLLNRSGNRGECGQICRTWFKTSEKTKDYAFSLQDLALDEDIIELAKIGIASLKIEGRMKSPEYAANTSVWYKSILDNKSDLKAKENSRTAFSRSNAKGYFYYPETRPEINHDYPEHKGLYIGDVISSNKKGFSIKPEKKISVRDGILYKSENGEYIKQGIAKILKSGKKLFSAFNEEVFIFTQNQPLKGSPVFKISSHNTELKKLNPDSFQSYKKGFILNVNIEENSIEFKCRLNNSEIAFSDRVEVLESQNTDWQKHLKKALNKSGNHSFTPENIIIKNNTPYTNVFIQPGLFKKIKNSFYELLESENNNYMKNSLQMEFNSPVPVYINDFKIPERSSLIPQNEAPLPFVTDFENIETEMLHKLNDFYFIPLSPIVLDENRYSESLTSFIKNNKDKKLVLGLNNFAHIEMTKNLSEYENVYFFGDLYLYTANSLTADFYFKNIDKLLFIYYWIEGDDKNLEKILEKNSELNNRIIKIDKSFNAPLFISRTCLKYKDKNSCNDCTKKPVLKMGQNKNNYKAVIRNCITWFLKD